MLSIIPAINIYNQLRSQEASVTTQELAETIVKLFSANPDVLHVIVDILSDNKITEKELFVQKVLDAPASTTHQELEELLKKMAAEHHLRSLRK